MKQNKLHKASTQEAIYHDFEHLRCVDLNNHEVTLAQLPFLPLPTPQKLLLADVCILQYILRNFLLVSHNS